MAQDVNKKLEALATGLQQKEESESESSSSSESEEETGALDPMFGSGEFWPSDSHHRSDHADGFMMDFDQP
jgi:hypothetical protein